MSVATSSWDDLLQGEEIAYLGTEPARAARLAPLPDELHPRVREALAAQGIAELYTHQRAAWDAAARGEHVVVTTGTASGKTLAFNLPVLDAMARDAKNRALYLYPTKALAQDQLRSLSTFRLQRLRAAIYDGDTETERRWPSEPSSSGPRRSPTRRSACARPRSARARACSASSSRATCGHCSSPKAARPQS